METQILIILDTKVLSFTGYVTNQRDCEWSMSNTHIHTSIPIYLSTPHSVALNNGPKFHFHTILGRIRLILRQI